jgi:hypothetical protein
MMQQFIQHTFSICLILRAITSNLLWIMILKHQTELVQLATHFVLLYVSDEGVLFCHLTRICLQFIPNPNYLIMNWVSDI